jgi:diguanylate cyclase (GGDEF)-like protein/PAS domain S-box-containing protein
VSAATSALNALNDHRTPRRALAVALPICVLYATGAAVGWGSPALGIIMSDLAVAVVIGVLALICLLRALPRSQTRRWGWVWFGLAAAVTSASNLLWGWEDVTGRSPAYSPVGTSALALLAAPLALAGLVQFVRASRRTLVWLCLMLDGWLVAGSLFTVAWSFALGNMAGDDLRHPLRVFLTLAYPVLDVLFISVLLGLRPRTRDSERAGLSVAVVAFGVTAVSDVFWAIPQVRGLYTPGGWLDAGWFTGVVLLAVAAWCGGHESVGTRSGDSVTLLGALTPYLAAGVSACAVIGNALSGHAMDPVVLLVGGSVFVVLMIRQAATLLDNVVLTRELAVREDLFRSLVQGSSDVMMISTLDGEVRYVSPAVERMYGFPPQEVLGTELRVLVHPDDLAKVHRAIGRFLEEDLPTARVDCRIRSADGSWRHTESTVSRHPEGLIFNSRDVTERVALQEQLAYFAFHDSLTGLPNRALFAERIGQALSAAGDTAPARIAVIFLDLDGFKAVNDSSGHAAGDELLVRAAERLAGAVRSGDMVARFGGDEFAALLCHDVTPAATRAVAERLLAALSEPYRVAAVEVVVAASIGVAFSTPGITSEELMRNADLAMYRAKAAGKGRVEVYAPHMHADVVHRVQLESRLRRAMRDRRFTLLYQPVVDLRTGVVTDVEALIRWRSEGGALITPAEFIRLAEDSGGIVPLGRWVIGEALRQTACWQRAGHHVGVSVNLSARQVLTPGLVESIDAALRETRVAPGRLTLEITENVLLDGAESTIGRLATLKDIGVRLAIDDFGTGYSSLSYLRRLPVDILKIDRSFVSGLGVEEEATSLASTIVRLGCDLGLTLIAEGIEKPSQARLLRAMGCHRGQGFWFSGPLDPPGVAAVLGRGLAPQDTDPAGDVFELAARRAYAERPLEPQAAHPHPDESEMQGA